jgi:hypothetical protein
MKPELQAELFRRYPKLFRKPGKRLVAAELVCELEERFQDNTAPIDRWGIECGDGWFALIDRLSQACEREVETLLAQGVSIESWPRIAQIKEKMGGLRFYVNGPLSEEVRATIFKVENAESQRICEGCGAPGKLREGRWRHTYCDDCNSTE